MDVGNHVVITDKYKTTNGDLVGIKGKITRIDDDPTYPFTVSLNNGEIELFTKEELTLIESDN